MTVVLPARWTAFTYNYSGNTNTIT